nr:DUF6876 family protein [Gloeothece verrucosa]
MAYTEGVRSIAQKGGAYWLLDAIGSYQPKNPKEPYLADFQLWILSILNAPHQPPEGIKYPFIVPSNSHYKAVLTCWHDTPETPSQEQSWKQSTRFILAQDIYSTNFPLAEISLYVCPTVVGDEELPLLMLPGEY